MSLKYGPLCVLRGHRSHFLKHAVFVSIKIVFALVNSVDPDEMPPNAQELEVRSLIHRYSHKTKSSQCHY